MAGLLEIETISKRFRGLQALDNVSFAVDEGGVFGVIGANGAGKTTLFNIISGAMKPDSGTVRFAGQVVTGHTPSSLCEAGIGRTFQIARPFPDLTVLETIRVAVLCRVRNMRAATARAADIAGRFGLAQKLDRGWPTLERTGKKAAGTGAGLRDRSAIAPARRSRRRPTSRRS